MTDFMTDPKLEREDYLTGLALQIKNYGSNTIPAFGGSKQSDRQEENPYQSIHMTDYEDLCLEYLGEGFLDDYLRELRKNYFEQDADIKTHLPAGSRVCPVPIPCTENGYRMEPQDIKNGMHFRTLVLDSQDLAQLGFSKRGSNIFKILPLEVRQQLVFTIPPYSNGPEGEVVPADREKILQLLDEKIVLAQSLFSHAKPPKPTQS